MHDRAEAGRAAACFRAALAATRSTPPSISPGSASASTTSPRSATIRLSDEMIAGWAAEGVGTERVVRLPGKLPGLYMIQTDDKGERRFFHWRDSAAARSLMDLPETRGHPAIRWRATTWSISRRSRSRCTARRDGAAVRGARARARAGRAFRLRHQFPRPRLARSRRRARRLSARPSPSPISCWPRPRICCRSIPAKANEALAGADSGRRGGAEAFGAGEHRAVWTAFPIRSRPSR